MEACQNNLGSLPPDETHFHLSAYVNKQNFQYSRANNLQFVHEQVHVLLMNELLCDALFHELESLDLIFLKKALRSL